MEENQRKKLFSLGVDYEEVIERFVNNEGLYIRCLNKFLDDKNYSEMLKAIENEDSNNAFEAAHALKGVAGNLGFSSLYEEAREITEVFRAGSLDYDEGNLDRLKAEYSHVCETIKDF